MANINLGHIKGEPGVGVPSGGNSGQYLAKNSGSDYDMSWVNPPDGAFNPYTAEKIYIYAGGSNTGYYKDKNGNQTSLTISSGVFSLPAGIFDDGELHQIAIELIIAQGSYPMNLRYNGTVKVKFSQFVSNATASSYSFYVDNNVVTWTPTTNIFAASDGYRRFMGYIWVQKTT